MTAGGKEKVLVLGAGLQGVCAALALRQRGHDVCLIDQATGCLERTSLRNEGKIHLGHVYAHDPGFKTADLMLRSALSFAPLLDQWLPAPINWPGLRSNPFFYIVARDSLVPEDRLFEHYAKVEDRCRELQSDDTRLHYLGQHLSRLWEPRRLPPQLKPASIHSAVWTPEASLGLPALRQIIAGALESESHIKLMYGHRVDEVARRPHGFTVTGVTSTGERWSRDAGIVVNALWDGRLAIDAQLGLRPRRPWVYRLKHRVIGRTPPSLAGLPSMTFVLGAFGDVVTHPADDYLYLSWYPSCMTGWSQALLPPAAWSDASTGALDASAQKPIIQNTLAAFEALIPGLCDTRDPFADGGVIFSWGDSDIDDTESELHQRHQIGIIEADGYYSINTGKLTSAPLFAQQLAALVP